MNDTGCQDEMTDVSMKSVTFQNSSFPLVPSNNDKTAETFQPLCQPQPRRKVFRTCPKNGTGGDVKPTHVARMFGADHRVKSLVQSAHLWSLCSIGCSSMKNISWSQWCWYTGEFQAWSLYEAHESKNLEHISILPNSRIWDIPGSLYQQ